MAKIRAKGSGPISLRGTDETDGIAEQFGGTKPDGVSEYYRDKDYGAAGGGVIVADSTDNAAIAKAGAQAFSNYYGTGKPSLLVPGPPGLGTPDEIDNAFGEAPDGAAQTPKDTLNKTWFCFNPGGAPGFSRQGKSFSDGSVYYSKERLNYQVRLSSAYLQKIFVDHGQFPAYQTDYRDYISVQVGLSYKVDTPDTDPRGHTNVYLTQTVSAYTGTLKNHRRISGATLSALLKGVIIKVTFTNPQIKGNYPVDGPLHSQPTMIGYFHVDMVNSRSVLLHKASAGGVESVASPPPANITRVVAAFGGVEHLYKGAEVHCGTQACILPYSAETKGAVIAEYGGWDPWVAKGFQSFPRSPLTVAPYIKPLATVVPAKDVIVLRFTSVSKPLTFGGGTGHVSATIHASMNGAARVGLTVYVMGKWIGAPGNSWSGGAKLVAVGAGGTTDASGNFSVNLQIPPKPAGAKEFWVGCTYLTTAGKNVAGTPDSRRVIP